jgi:hypothetical protein
MDYTLYRDRNVGHVTIFILKKQNTVSLSIKLQIKVDKRDFIQLSRITSSTAACLFIFAMSSRELTTLLTLLAFLTLVPAQDTTTTPNTTGSDDRVGWVSGQGGRSTSNIIWSCFATFLVCSWKCVHLNIPSREESEAGWYTLGRTDVPFWPKPLRRRQWQRKLAFMCIIAIAPEVGVAMAVRQYLEARRARAAANRSGGNWSMAHAFYANMHGFVLRIPNQAPPQQGADTSGPADKQLEVSQCTDYVLSLRQLS